MDWTLAQALVTLREQINALWPDRDKTSDGSIGDEAHQARRSDHNPDEDGVVTAIDITDDDSVGADMRKLAESLRVNKDERIKYVIHEGKMFSSYASGTYDAWTWRPYSGVNGHFNHLHISVWGDDRKYINSDWRICMCDLTQEEVDFFRTLKETVESVNSNATFPAYTIDLVRRERVTPLHPH